jgi:long-chain acyl-CoA synthetase
MELEFRTLNEMFLRRVEASASRRAYLFHRGGRWVDVTWAEMGREVDEVANGLLSLGFAKSEAASIIGETRPEWGICDLAILAAGGRSVGIYQTSTAKQCEHILVDSGSRFVFVENLEQLEKILEIRGNCPALQKAILWEGTPPQNGGFVLSYEALRQMGRELARTNPTALDERRRSVVPSDEALLIYTSGTTGMPKGAILTHKNLCTVIKIIHRMAPLTEDDITVCFLPLAHGAERVVGFYNRISLGVQAAFARSIPLLLEDIRMVRPTIFGSVPRIFEKAYSRIQTEVQKAPPLRRRLALWAFGVGREVSRLRRQGVQRLPPLLEVQHRLADRLVLSKIRELFGGRCKYFITGAAPISLEILEFFDGCGMKVLEAYGLTESTVIATANRHDDYRLGTVGKALPGVQIKIAPDGEILIKGDTVFKGYHNLPEETREAIDKEGWLHTGDIGDFDKDGFLRITDRKKNLIITAGGKNIAPANIENLIKGDPLVGHVVAIGDRRPYVVALISLDPEATRKLASDHGLPSDLRAIANHPVVRERLQRTVDAANRELARFEQVKRFAVLPGELTQEAGELTPTLKVKRKVVEEKYKALIDAMYAEGSEAEARTG